MCKGRSAITRILIFFELQRHVFLYLLKIQSSDDITGTLISASKPIAVLSGTMWTSVVMENMGDHLVEMLPPIPMWGIEFWTIPVANRSSGDVFRILGICMQLCIFGFFFH